MPKKIEFALSNAEGDHDKEVNCKDFNKNDYDTRYKGHLTCINGCKARIKYTERKNNVKFFSTWNKEGNLHDEGCPYHVDYKGKKGREKLIAFHENAFLDDDTILERLKWKLRALSKKYDRDSIEHPENGTAIVVNSGEGEVEVPVESENGEAGKKKPNIHHVHANYVTKDDVGCKKSVFGTINNIQIVKEEGSSTYAYFNLTTENLPVNIYFPEAFYSNELENDVKRFEKYIDKVAKMVEKNPEGVMAIAYGDIKVKKKIGMNVNVISTKRIFVNGKTYLEILNDVTL